MVRVFLCVFLLLTSASGWAAMPLRIGVEEGYIPFSYKDKDGKLTGFDVEIAHALCEELKEKCTLIPMKFDYLLPAVTTGELDMAVAGIIPTDERRRNVDFTDHYYRTYSVFVGRVDIGDIEDLKGGKIGVQRGTTQQAYLEKTYRHLAEIVVYEDFQDLSRDLKAEKLKAILTPGLPVYDFLKSEEGSNFEIIGSPVRNLSMHGHASIAVNKKRPQLTNRLNTAIETIRMNGIHQSINRKYFNFNIY